MSNKLNCFKWRQSKNDPCQALSQILLHTLSPLLARTQTNLNPSCLITNTPFRVAPLCFILPPASLTQQIFTADKPPVSALIPPPRLASRTSLPRAKASSSKVVPPIRSAGQRPSPLLPVSRATLTGHGASSQFLGSESSPPPASLNVSNSASAGAQPASKLVPTPDPAIPVTHLPPTRPASPPAGQTKKASLFHLSTSSRRLPPLRVKRCRCPLSPQPCHR